MIDLFAETRKQDSPAGRPERFDWYTKFCRERFSVPDDWRWYRLQVVNFNTAYDATMVTGAVCREMFKSGPRKGRENWAKRDKSTEAVFSIPVKEMRAFQREWEIATGKCSICQGHGEEVSGWVAGTGTTYRTCSKCHGLGTYALTGGQGGTAA